MPSVSEPQHRWIEWVAHNPAARAHTGLSQAKASEWAHSDRGSPWKHRDIGGGLMDPSTGPGGLVPSAANQNPLAQGAIQNYQQMPTEKLQEALARFGGPGSPQGQIISRVLRQKQMHPQMDQPQPGMGLGQPGGTIGGFKTGGALPKRDSGGDMGVSPSMASPWWTRREASTEASGFLHGTTLGQADQIRTTAPGGAYVLPAELVAGLGEGNNLAGARVADAMFSTGPHGISLPRLGGGGHRGRAPAPYREVADGGEIGRTHV